MYHVQCQASLTPGPPSSNLRPPFALVFSAIRQFDGHYFPHWDDAGWLKGTKESVRGQCGFATALAKGDHHASAAGRSFYAWSLALGDNHEPTADEKRTATCAPAPSPAPDAAAKAPAKKDAPRQPRKPTVVCRRGCPCEPDRHGVSVWM